MSKKLYFSKYDGFEWAHPISRWKEIMQEEGIKTIELIRAKADRGTGYFFCNEYQEFGESKDSCGKQCDKYSPRNGKNGICRHNDPPYEPDESETLTLNRKT